jgi:hypothetical protein
MNNKLLPDSEPEILRHLYANDFDEGRAYLSMKYRFQYRDNNFPITISQNMVKLLNGGGIYIHGRDKNFRPVVIVNIVKFIKFKANFGKNNVDLINVCIFLMEYIDQFYMLRGHIENIVLIVDCAEIGFLNAPYIAFK